MSKKKTPSSTSREVQVEDERDPTFLDAPPQAPPMPGVAPSEAPQIDEDTEIPGQT